MTSADQESTIEAGGARPRGRGVWRRLLGVIVTSAVIGGAAAAAVVTVEALQRRADEAQAVVETIPPLPVAVARLERRDGYEATERFAGRVEAARSADLSFERAGRVSEVLVEEGDAVAEGDVIARLDVDRLQAERARLAADRARIEAQLRLAERTQARQQRLSRRGFAPEQALDEAVSNEASLRAELAALDAREASLDVDFEDSELRAPFAGRIAAQTVDLGAYVGPGVAVARILEVGRPQARIGLSVEQAARLESGLDYDIAVGERIWRARLAARRPDLDPATRTVSALFDLLDARDGGDAAPVFGEVARLSLSISVDDPGAWAPLTALQEGLRGLWTVYVAAPDEAGGYVLEQEAVEVLHVADGRAFIRTALADGALIVVSGAARVTRGRRVRPMERDRDAFTEVR